MSEILGKLPPQYVPRGGKNAAALMSEQVIGSKNFSNLKLRCFVKKTPPQVIYGSISEMKDMSVQWIV